MYNPQQTEPQIFDFWEKEKIYELVKKKNSKGKNIYFLDGPPYTTGEIHVGTAWNKSLKDFYLRFMRMQGYNVWDKAGWDMHGLPITHKVLKKLNLEKQDIEEYGVEKFIKTCQEFAVENMNIMTEQFKRIGVWMDWDNAYKSIDSSFMEGVWNVVKKAHDNGYLYQGKKTMHWCPSCATSLAKHELDYKEVTDESIFVKFPIENKKDEYLLVWTTTPWTMPFNLAVMVNPTVDYIKAELEVDGNKEKWIIAKALSTAVLSGMLEKEFKIIEEFKGNKLKSLSYKQPFFDEIPFHQRLKKENNKAFTVVLSEEYVDTSSGSGLVHCAPGCGPEDYEVGHRERLPPYNTLNENGILDETGSLSGLKAKKDDKKFISALKEKGLLVESTKVTHDYPHCWRCNSAVVFRTTDQWFFDVESKLKNKMIELNKQVKWQPSWAGDKWMNSWLENLRDNGITRQIYWGTPLPVWICDSCKSHQVIGSREELSKFNKKIPKDLHRPYIDEVKWDCNCGGTYKRVLDVLDVWVDAGCTSFTCLDYPTNLNDFKKYWPADFILEGKDQIRGWFNLLLVASMVSLEKHPYQSVYMHGFINDSKGRKMSKSLGNITSPKEVLDKYGADATRFYMISATPPGLDLNYDHREAEIKFRNLTIFHNISKYLKDYSQLIRKPSFNAKPSSIEEKYILSKLNNSIKKVKELFSDLQFNKIPSVIESLFLELSRFYIQVTRDKFSSGTNEEKESVLDTLSEVYYKSLLLLSPICPFISEEIYKSLKQSFDCSEFENKSIHLCEFPKVNEKLIDEDLEKQVETSKEIIEAALSAREEAKIGLRWPLSTLEVSGDELVIKSISNLSKIIEKQVNVKEVTEKKLIKGKEFRNGMLNLITNLTPELEKEGYTREVTRRIQSMRRKLGLQKQDKINLNVSSIELEKILDVEKIKELVNAVEVNISSKDYSNLGSEDTFKIKNKELVISIKKL